VPGEVGRAPFWRVQPPAHIEEANAATRVELGRELVSTDEQGHAMSFANGSLAVASE